MADLLDQLVVEVKNLAKFFHIKVVKGNPHPRLIGRLEPIEPVPKND